MNYPHPTAHLRASDADRDTVLMRLTDAYAQGRLAGEEHTERIDAASHSRTYGELAQLVEDLPAAPNLARVYHLADELLAEVGQLGISHGELVGLLASRS